jgi:branched-chain amino acid transport system ATP-binding protein
MRTPILAVENLTKYFGGLRAVHLSLAVEEGELRCIIGPNGAGKSTFFNILTGSIRPNSGTIRFRGRSITGMSAHRIARLGISMKFQVPTMFDQLSILQNLHTAAEFRFGYATGLDRAYSMLDLLKLTHRAHEPAAWLSYGEKQWLEIGMAAIIEPTLMLLDEPTAGMSKEEVASTVILLEEFNRRATLIVIEHDMTFVRRVSRRVSVMHRGILFAEGDISAIEGNSDVRDIYLGREGSRAGAR